jgi:hypothetical protein
VGSLTAVRIPDDGLSCSYGDWKEKQGTFNNKDVRLFSEQYPSDRQPKARTKNTLAIYTDYAGVWLETFPQPVYICLFGFADG